MQANRITSIYETLPAVLYQFPTGKAILIDWTNETFLQKIMCACLPRAGQGAQLDNLSQAQAASMNSLPRSSSSPPIPTFTLPISTTGHTQPRWLTDQGSRKANTSHNSKQTPNETAFNSLFTHWWSCLFFGELTLGQPVLFGVLPASPTAKQSSHLLLSRQQL